MSVKNRVQVLDDLVEIFTPDDLRWLWEQLDRLLDDQPQPESELRDDDDDAPLPESATLDEAIDLFLADKCSLGRAAELAGVTRWDIQDILKERNIPIYGGSEMSVEEMYDQIEWLEERGIL
jgi:predicted HTH domain antitoxin